MNNIGASTISEVETLKRNIADLEKEKYYLIGRVKELSEELNDLKGQKICECPPIVKS